MEFVAEAEVCGGLPQAHIWMREQERTHSFQPVLALELAGSFPHDGGKASGKRLFADKKVSGKLLLVEKAVWIFLQKAHDILDEFLVWGRRGRVLRVPERGQQKLEQGGKPRLPQRGGCGELLRDRFK